MNKKEINKNRTRRFENKLKVLLGSNVITEDTKNELKDMFKKLLRK